MDGSGNHDGWRQWQWATGVQWAAGQQTNCDGQWDSIGAMDGTMGGRQLPPTQMRCNGRQSKMGGSSNHNGQWWRDRNGRWQRQWAAVAQWAAVQQSNWDGQWDSGSTMNGTMSSRQLLSTQKGHNGRLCKMDSRDNHNEWWQHDCDGRAAAIGNGE